MAAATVPPITVEQFLNFKAPEGFRAELIRGEIILSPDPKPLHHDIVENIYAALKKELVATRFKVGMRCNMNMADVFSMPSPDVFVVTHETWRRAREVNVYPQGSPLLAVEVVSPSNRERHVRAKTDLYLKAGTLAVWNVYPNERLVTSHTTTGSMKWEPGQSLPSPFGVAVDPAEFFHLS